MSSPETFPQPDEQPALFELNNADAAQDPVQGPVLPPHLRRSFRDDEDYRISEAQAELGGGPAPESLAVDPPRLRPARKVPKARKRTYLETDGRTATLDHDKNDPVPAETVTVDESEAAREYKAARALLQLAEDRRRADGDPRIEIALSASRNKQV